MAERSSFGFGERVLRVFPKRIGPGNRMRGSGVGSSVRESSDRSGLSTARCACWELHQTASLCLKIENCSWSWRFLAARSMLGLRLRPFGSMPDLPEVRASCRQLRSFVAFFSTSNLLDTLEHGSMRTEDVVPISVTPRSWPSKMLWSSEALPNVRDEPGGPEPC